MELAENIEQTLDPVDAAAQAYRIAAKAEADAKLARLEAEERLVALVGQKTEGAQTTKTGRFKVTTTGKLTRRLDYDRYKAIASEHPEVKRLNVVRMKPDLSLTALRKVQENQPDLYGVLSQCITTAPAKPAGKVEVL